MGTLNSLFGNVKYAINLQMDEIFRLQEQVSSGSRINRPSDDPSAAYRVLNMSSHGRSLDNYIDNISLTSGSLEFMSTSIDNIKTALADAKQLLGEITSGVGGGIGTNVTVEGINDALERIVAAANAEHTGKYLFGGSDTNTRPFEVTKSNGLITSVTYQGSTTRRDVEIASGIDVTAYYTGKELFYNNERTDPTFTGQTGAAAGTGTSNVTGDVTMIVTHDGSNYRISIDDGVTETVVPAGGSTNQAVYGANGTEILYVDTTGINSTGTEWVQVPGTYNIFDTLITLRDKLNTTGGLSTTEIEELRYNAFETIDELNGMLIQKSVMIGAKIGFLDDLKGDIETLKYNTEDEITRAEEADIAQLAIDLSRREILYEMSLSMASKLLSISLMDFL